MKLSFKFKKKIKNILSFCVILFFLIFHFNFQILNALSMDTYQSGFITEELRLKIPSGLKEVWLEAEKIIWEPWLSEQDGFLGRQIFWDKDKEEALILVNWKNKKLWKSISMKEVNELQEQFEEKVKKSLNVNVNPFKLIHEGELYKQG